MRTMCEYNLHLGVCLKVEHEAPLPLDQLRWHAEPVQCLDVPLDTFALNRKGFPVLRPEHKALVSSALRFGVQVSEYLSAFLRHCMPFSCGCFLKGLLACCVTIWKDKGTVIPLKILVLHSAFSTWEI